MIKQTWRLLVQYWELGVAFVVLGIALIFQLLGLAIVAHWLLGITALALTIPPLVGMWENLQTGRYGIDILAVTAIITAVILHQYWAAIAVVIVLASSKVLGSYAERRAHSELSVLLKSRPVLAHVLRGRKSFDVAATELHSGDKFVVQAGEIVPADAIILEGSANFDESLLTGKRPGCGKDVGERILGGSINLDGEITARAIHAAADSQYEQIVKIVRGAASKQAPFVRLADRYSIPFVIAAYAIAIAAWVIGHGAIRFLDVIIVASPCPLLLAAPIALIAGMSRASKQGIIVKTGAALEKLAETQTLAFGKTGILTSGKLQIENITAFKPYTKDEVLDLATSLEQNSTHPIAAALVKATRSSTSTARAKHVQAFSGRGLRAMLRGKDVLVGSRNLLAEHHVVVPNHPAPKHTICYVAVDGQVAGFITFQDEPRAETKRTLQKLQRLGIKRLILISGDSQSAAAVVGKQLGITDIHAEVSPADKLRIIESFADKPVAFVGDGMNDAPVLTAADVGVALGARRSTSASESADITIMSDDFSYIAVATGIARRTFAIAKQTILVGTSLSLILMLIFATGHFPPLLGAILQGLIDVFVVFSALRAHHTPKTS